MLNGIARVKADRMIRRFVAEALGIRKPDVQPATARTLITEASNELQIDQRITDFAICEAMSTRWLLGANPSHDKRKPGRRSDRCSSQGGIKQRFLRPGALLTSGARSRWRRRLHA